MKYKWKTFLVHIDDVVIFSNNVDEHILRFDEICTTLSEAIVALKIKKCHFRQRQVEYLGLITKAGQLEIDQMNVRSIQQTKSTTRKMQIISFLGM